jgi:hypothetical protein
MLAFLAQTIHVQICGEVSMYSLYAKHFLLDVRGEKAPMLTINIQPELGPLLAPF